MLVKKNKFSKPIIFIIFIVILSVITSSFAFQDVSSSSDRVNPGQSHLSSDSSTSYLVQFVESGLPSVSLNSGFGALWAIKVAGQIHESSTKTIAIYMQPALNISYSVVKLANYTSTPSSGTFNVSNSNVVIGVSFTPTVYRVSFNETGLPSSGSATEWKLSFNGNTLYSNSSSICLIEPDGKYNYSIPSESIYLPSPSSGTIFVNGSNIDIPVQFTNNLESVTFFETGLPTYLGSTETQWSVTLSNTTSNFNASQSSFNNSITFTVPSGNYSYSVAQIRSYNLVGGSGTVNVENKFKSVQVTFTTTFYGIEFQETGLPSVTPLWSVSLKNITSGQVTTNYATSPNLYFNVSNGNYQFKASSIDGYSLLPATGYVSVSNGFYIIKLQYTSYYGTITFKEKGLFSNTTKPSGSFGSYWSVTMINSTGYHFVQTSDGSSITFWLPNGTYNYYTSNNTGFTPGNETGSVTVVRTVTIIEHVTYTLNDILSQSSGILSTINLYELGLPAGTKWSVALSNSSTNSTSQVTTSALITYYVPNGNYYIRILDSGSMQPNLTSIYVTVNSATQTIYNYTVNFKFTPGYLNFTETGLQHGTLWSVAVYSSFGTSSTYSSVFDNLSIPLANGTYFYVVLASSTNVNPFGSSSNYVYISTSHSINSRVSFISDQYNITFNEHGLSLGQSWNLLVMDQSGNIISYSATSGLLNIPLQNGTYRFSAVAGSGFLAYPSLSWFTVNGTSSSLIQHNITFVSNIMVVNFDESGLLSGTEWSVTLNGLQKTSNIGIISFSLPGGIYVYNLPSTGQYSPLQSVGIVTVANSNKTIPIQFHSIVSTVTFEVSSLPANYTWSVYVGGQVLETSNQSVSVSLQNGTYQFQTLEQGFYYPTNPYGLFTVSGQSTTITIYFVSIQYTVSIKENGLPSGLAWTAQIINETGVLTAYTSVDAYSNISLLNGSYSFNMLATNFYVSIPGSGAFTVNGTSLTLSLEYKLFTYYVNFTASDLPPGDSWNISLTSQYGITNYSLSTTSLVSFKVVNGTYSFKVMSQNKSVAPSPISGTLNVSGAAVSVPILFSPVVYTAQLKESGLAKGVTWSIVINGVTYTSKNASINVTLLNGTYDFTVLNVTSGYTFSPTNGKLIIKGANISTIISYSLIVTIYHENTTKTNYNTFIVLGTLVGIGVIGLGVIMALYYQRKKS
ncbi:MAG: hypothetical protein QXU18_00830 [Thermoplasmatales archaeon]